MIERKLSSRMTISPASRAASVPLPIANPTSARRSAGESLTPSPVMPTTRFIFCESRTIRDLSVGSARAMTRSCGSTRCTSSSRIWARSLLVRTKSPSARKSPASRAIATAVSRRSPVTMTTCTPAACTSVIAARASGRTSSRIAAKPIRTTSALISFFRKGCSEYPNASTRIARVAYSFIFAFSFAASNEVSVPSARSAYCARARSASGAPL